MKKKKNYKIDYKKKKDEVSPSFPSSNEVPKYYTGVQSINYSNPNVNADLMVEQTKPDSFGQHYMQTGSAAAGIANAIPNTGNPYIDVGKQVVAQGAAIYKAARDRNTQRMASERQSAHNEGIAANTYLDNPYSYQTAAGGAMYEKGTKSIGVPKYVMGTAALQGSQIASAIPNIAGAVAPFIKDEKDAAGLLAVAGGVGAIGQGIMGGIPMMEKGGETPNKTIEVEKGELRLKRIGDKFKLVRNYNGDGYKLHEDGGEIDNAEEGDVIIPKNKSKYILSKVKGGDKSTKVGGHIMGNDIYDVESVISKLPKDKNIPMYQDGVGEINPDYNNYLVDTNDPDFGVSAWNDLLRQQGNYDSYQKYLNESGVSGLNRDTRTAEDVYNIRKGFNSWLNPPVDQAPYRTTKDILPASSNRTGYYPEIGQGLESPSRLRTAEPIPNQDIAFQGNVDSGYQQQRTNFGNVGYRIGEALPTLYNLGMGAFGSVDSLHLNRFDPRLPQYRDLSERDRLAAQEGSAVARYNMGKRYMSRGQGIGESSAIEQQRQRTLGQINQNEARRYDQISQAGVGIQNQAQMYNLAKGDEEIMYGKQADAAKQRMLAEGLYGAAGLSQNALQRGEMRKRNNLQYGMDLERLNMQRRLMGQPDLSPEEMQRMYLSPYNYI